MFSTRMDGTVTICFNGEDLYVLWSQFLYTQACKPVAHVDALL
jgi:hypothetical protein